MDKKVLIGVPFGRPQCSTKFAQSLFALKADKEAYFVENSLVDLAREEIARYAIEKKYDYVLFIDDDMVFQPTALERLLETKKSFVCGWFVARIHPHHPCIYEKVWKDEEGGHVQTMSSFPSTVKEIEGCGMAFTLIKTSILEAVANRYGTMFGRTKSFGEDLSFCMRARSLGTKIYCQPKCSVGHCGEEVFYG